MTDDIQATLDAARDRYSSAMLRKADADSAHAEAKQAYEKAKTAASAAEVSALHAALRAAEEAARKPRLRTHAEFGAASCGPDDEARIRIFGGVCAALRDAEWIAAIKALRTRKRLHGPDEGPCWPRSTPSYETTVDLADILALAPEHK